MVPSQSCKPAIVATRCQSHCCEIDHCSAVRPCSASGTTPLPLVSCNNPKCVTVMLYCFAGNQYIMLVLYMHIAEALGLPVTLVGTSDHMMLQLGDASTTNSAAAKRPYYTQGVISEAGGSSSSSLTSSDIDFMPLEGFTCEQSAADDRVDGKNSLLHGLTAEGLAAVQLYQEMGLLNEQPRSINSSTTGSSSGSRSNPAAFCTALTDAVLLIDVTQQGRLYCWWPGGSTSHAARGATVAEYHQGNDSGQGVMSSTSGEGQEDYNGLEGGAWGRVKQQWDKDARSRNSWKALYGPGALVWHQGVAGESDVSSSSSTSSSSSGDMGNGGSTSEAAVKMDGGSAMGPPAAAGGSGENVKAHGQGSGQPAEASKSVGGVAPGEEAGAGRNRSRSSSSGSGCSTSEEELVVSPLSSKQLLQLGGLQPVSHRMLLMQLLSAMKLPLIMMGRTEDALATIR